MRVLAVDDDPIILDMLKVSLHRSGLCDLVVATSAEEAMSALAEASEPFDCFLLDVVMPEKDGIALCADIRAMSSYRQTPIIMITALTGAEPLDRAFAAGATDYVCKPLNGLELGTRINLANMLNESLRREAAKEELLKQQMAKTTSKVARVAAFEGVEGVVDILRLENNLLRLPEGCYALNLVAFDVIGSGSGSQAQESLDAAIQIAAKTIATVLSDRRLTLSHAGEGIFVGFYSGRRVIALADLQLAINQELARNGAQDSISIKVTIPTSQRLISGRAAIDVLMNYVDNRLHPSGQDAPVGQEIVKWAQEQAAVEFQSYIPTIRVKEDTI